MYIAFQNCAFLTVSACILQMYWLLGAGNTVGMLLHLCDTYFGKDFLD